MTKDDVLHEAEHWLGYLEKKSNKQLEDFTANAGDGNFTIFWEKLKPSYQGQPWCDAFVKYCFDAAYGPELAKRLLCHGTDSYSFYTPTSADYFKRQMRFLTYPKVGDVVFFKNSTRICHTGIVVGVHGDQIDTIEGNTSAGSQVIPNGGAVCRKTYPAAVGGYIAGYGRPDWSLLEDCPKYSVGWHQDSRGWWYANTPDTYLHDTWFHTEHCEFYFDSEGYAVTGCQTIQGKRYYFEDSKGAPEECALMITGPDGALTIKHH